jgi:hypothetical protein
LPLKYFCWIFPLKEEKEIVKSAWDFNGVTLISAVPFTPRKSFQRCQWHHWNSNIIDFLGEYESICETALGRESGP